MKKRPTTPKSESAIERRKLILQCAGGLFDKMGYFNTSMNDIADVVGLSKSTLYYYMSSKEEILFLIHEELINHLIFNHQNRLKTRMSCSQLLQEVMIDILEQIHDYPGYARTFFEHYRQMNNEMSDISKLKRDSYFDSIIDVFKKGMEQGEFIQNNPKTTAFAFFGMCNWAYQWYNPKGEQQPREIALLFWDIFMHGLESK